MRKRARAGVSSEFGSVACGAVALVIAVMLSWSLAATRFSFHWLGSDRLADEFVTAAAATVCHDGSFERLAA